MPRVRAFVLPPVVLVVLVLALTPTGAEEEAAAPEPRVVCSGLVGTPTPNAPIGGPWRTDLLVVGEVTEVGEEVWCVRVAEAFYDRPPSDEISFRSWCSVRTGRRVLVLESRPSKGERWALVESVPATDTNLLAARALGGARLTHDALGASLIFVGRQTSLAPTRDLGTGWERSAVRSVTVDRVVVGPSDLQGRSVRVLCEWLSSSTEHEPLLQTEERVYFVGTRGPDDPPPQVECKEDPPCYRASASVAVAVLPEVEAALQRRDRYPIVTKKRWGHHEPGEETERVREVCFLGSVEDALSMVGADLEGGYALAARSLALRPEASREAVLGAVRERMYDHAAGPRGRHELLRRLLHTLALVEEEAPTGALDKLVVEYLDRLRSSTQEPIPPPAYETAPGSEVHRTDVNRALLWLLSETGREEALRHAERLRSDRDLFQGPWRRELQVALDYLAVEDTEALLEALERGRALPPPVQRQVVEPGTHAGVFALAHHSSLLALEGPRGHVRLRDALTWEGRDVESLETIEGLAFSPDDVHLFVAGGGGGTVQRHVVATGERDLVYEGHDEGVEALLLLREGQVLVTLSDRGSLLLFHDASSGKLLGREEVDGYRMVPSADGRGVVVHSFSKDFERRRRYFPIPATDAPSSPEPSPFPGGSPPPDWARSSDGRWLCCANEHVRSWADSPGTLVLYERKDSGYREVGRDTHEDAHAYGHVAISGDGRYVATGGRGRTVRVYATPMLEKVLEHRFPRSSASDWTTSGLAFSAGGKLLVVGFKWSSTPGLVRLDTMEVVRPWTGHGDDADDLFYAEGGAELRTIGRDEAVCRWHAHTLDPLGRYVLPGRFEVSQVHPTGSRILCLKHWTLSNYGEPGPDWPDGREATVLDARTGRTLSTFTLATSHARSRAWWLRDPDAMVLDLGAALVPLDARDGTVGDSVAYEGSHSGGAIEEDGKHLYRPDSGFKHRRGVEAWRIDLTTGASNEIHPKDPHKVIAEQAGLVPGGRHFFFAAPGLRIFERDTCEEVLHLPLVGVEIEDVAASPDGRSLALLSNGTLPKAVQEAIGTKSASILRVLDVGTGKTRLAFPLRGGAKALFSPDGKRVTVLTRGGRLLVWRVTPDPNRK